MFAHIRANLRACLCAAIVLTFSAWQGYEAFGSLYPNIRLRGASQFSPLSIKKSLLISLNSKCVGYLNSHFERTIEIANYTVQGELFISLDNVVLPTKVDFEASFNVLGQLAAGILQITSSAHKLTLGSLNVDPIELTLLISNQGRGSSRKTFSFPGPLILNDFGEIFELEYPAAKKSIPIVFDTSAVASLLSVQLSFLPDAKSSCFSGPKTSLDIMKLTAQLQKRFGAITAGLPPALLAWLPPDASKEQMPHKDTLNGKEHPP